jgi:thymidylate synthase (FAD)
MKEKSELVGWTIPVLDHGFVRLIDWMGDDQRIVEFARVSYKSPSKGVEQDTKLLHYLYKNKHTSPFEAVKVTFNIKMPIFVMRQYIRHRMQNVNEMSARYTELPRDFYIPTSWRAQDTKNKQSSVPMVDWNVVKDYYSTGHDIDGSTWNKSEKLSQHEIFSRKLIEHCDAAYNLYEWYLEQGVAREMARMVLPLNIYTEFYACWDLKNLMHFLQLREDVHAQFEIQEFARAIKEIVKKLFPVTIEAFDKYKWKITD